MIFEGLLTYNGTEERFELIIKNLSWRTKTANELVEMVIQVQYEKFGPLQKNGFFR
jgi:hypothetical protein